MTRHKILDLIVSSQDRLEVYSRLYRDGMYRRSLIYQLLDESELRRTLKTPGPAGICGVLLRRQQDVSCQYLLEYCINRKDQHRIEISNIKQDNKSDQLYRGLAKMNRLVEKLHRPGLIMACDSADATKVAETFKQLAYNVRTFGR